MNRPLCLLICEIILTEGEEEEEEEEEGGGEKKRKKRRKRKFRETIGCRVSSVFPSPFIVDTMNELVSRRSLAPYLAPSPPTYRE